jgi:gamma-glutamylputrescine oxidase
VVNYFRLTNDHRLLFGGGESYGQMFPADIASFVRARMMKVFPQLRDTGIDHAWGGTLAITRSRMPLFAKVKQNIWSASGYSGHGISIATLAGRIVSDAVQGNTEDFLAMVNMAPPRFPGGAALRSPLLMLAMLWYSLRDRM